MIILKNHNINILKKIKRITHPQENYQIFFWYNLPVNQILKNFEDINVLDIGCGNGNYYYIFKEILEISSKVTQVLTENLELMIIY